MNHPPVDGNTGATWQVLSLDVGAIGRDVAGDAEADRRPHPHALLQTGLEVGEVLCLTPLNVARARDGSRLHGHVDLEEKFGVDPGCPEHVPEKGLHRGGGGIGTGETRNVVLIQFLDLIGSLQSDIPKGRENETTGLENKVGSSWDLLTWHHERQRRRHPQ